MAMRAVVTRLVAEAPRQGIRTPAAGAVLSSARQAAAILYSLRLFVPQAPAASTPAPATSISSRAARGSKRSFEGDEFKPISLLGTDIDGGAARATTSVRARDHEDKKVSNKNKSTGPEAVWGQIQVADSLKYDAGIAAEKVAQNFVLLSKLSGVLANDKVEAERACMRASALDMAAEKCEVKHQEATNAADSALASIVDFTARGWSVPYDMEDVEWEARQGKFQAKTDARASRRLADKAWHVAGQWEDQVETSVRMLKRVQVIHASARRVAWSLDRKASRAKAVLETMTAASAQADNSTGMGGGLAPLVVEDVVGVGSPCNDDDQEEPKAKRARR